MAILDVNGTQYEVVGRPDWCAARTRRVSIPGTGGHYAETPVSPYIIVSVRIGPGRPNDFQPPSEVRLELDDGRVVVGQDMFDTGNGRVSGNVQTLHFMGLIEEI